MNKDHAVAQMQLDDRRVMALVLGLLDDVAPPHDHGVEHAEHQPISHEPPMIGTVVEPHDRADGQNEGRHAADDRPWARIDQMVIVMLCVGVSHFPYSSYSKSALGAVRAPLVQFKAH